MGVECSIDKTEESSTGAVITAVKKSFVHNYYIVDFFNLLMSQIYLQELKLLRLRYKVLLMLPWGSIGEFLSLHVQTVQSKT